MRASIILILDLTLIVLLTLRVVAINNDKMYIAFIFGYGMIVILNLILWALLSLIKSALGKEMGKIIIGLIILFIPLWIYVSQA